VLRCAVLCCLVGWVTLQLIGCVGRSCLQHFHHVCKVRGFNRVVVTNVFVGSSLF
jgi:hypothetical protein